MSYSVLECVESTKSFGTIQAVDKISLALAEGEIVGVLGPSGSGKTTLLRLIAGFEKITAGEIRIARQVVSATHTHIPSERRNVGVVFQEYALFPHLTVAENVGFGLRNLSQNEKHRRAEEVLKLVRLTGMHRRYPHELSGGEQQRVALARTLAPRPTIVLLDEPFSNLDASMRTEMRRDVGEILRESGTTALFVTHDREEAFVMANRVAVLHHGRLEQIDSPTNLYHSPKTPFVAGATGFCDFLQGQIENGRVSTDVGTLFVTNEIAESQEGGSVKVLIRIDDLQVAPDPNGSSTVLSREFRGDDVILVIQTSSGATVRCRRHHYPTLAPGTSVKLFSIRNTPFVTFPYT